MHNLQIKTLELLIVNGLQNPKLHNRNLYPAFNYITNHFADEEYLYGIEHSRIIDTIYVKNFYKYKTTRALSQELHVDTKTLLNYRKSYVQLFAKQYLNLSSPTNTVYFLLYTELKKISEDGAETSELLAYAEDSRQANK